MYFTKKGRDWKNHYRNFLYNVCKNVFVMRTHFHETYFHQKCAYFLYHQFPSIAAESADYQYSKKETMIWTFPVSFLITCLI